MEKINNNVWEHAPQTIQIKGHIVKKIILTILISLGALGLTATTANAKCNGGEEKAKTEKPAKCESGKCASGKCGDDKAKGKTEEAKDETKKDGKCGAGKCGSK